MRTQPTADECGISDIRYEDGSSLKNPPRQALIFRFCDLCSICYKIDSK